MNGLFAPILLINRVKKLEFKSFEISDYEHIRKYLDSCKEISSENSFINLLVWHSAYDNVWAEKDGLLIIKSGGENPVYRLPFGEDFDKGMQLIKEDCGKECPTIWANDGERFEKFKEYYGEKYIIKEIRDAFDYIYNSADLANLSGKKYHSKRNHISLFTKKFSWEFKPIDENNINDVKICAEEWFAENADRMDKYLICEKNGIFTVLDNMKTLKATGGAIFVDGKAVAFTIGSAINKFAYDIYFEKALEDYSEGYTVINREFAKTLAEYKYINREDDMGIEGLRHAKLSYKPTLMHKKYICKEKGNE